MITRQVMAQSATGGQSSKFPNLEVTAILSCMDNSVYVE